MRNTHRVSGFISDEQQHQRGSPQHTLGGVKPGEEGVGEEARDRDEADPALRSYRAYP